MEEGDGKTRAVWSAINAPETFFVFGIFLAGSPSPWFY
jgi:hypothetical protein